MARQPKIKVTRDEAYVDVAVGNLVGRIQRATPDQLFQAIMDECVSLYPGIDLSRPGIYDDMKNLRAAIEAAGLLHDRSPEDEARALRRLAPDRAVAHLVDQAKEPDAPHQPGRYSLHSVA